MNKQKLYDAIKTLNLTNEQRNDLISCFNTPKLYIGKDDKNIISLFDKNNNLLLKQRYKRHGGIKELNALLNFDVLNTNQIVLVESNSFINEYVVNINKWIYKSDDAHVIQLTLYYFNVWQETDGGAMINVKPCAISIVIDVTNNVFGFMNEVGATNVNDYPFM